MINETLIKIQQMRRDALIETSTEQVQAPVSLLTNSKKCEMDKQHFKTMGVSCTRKLVWSLVLNPRSIVLNIFPYRGQYIDWSSKGKVAYHLAALLQLDYSELGSIEVEKLPGTYLCKRILLHFCSNKISSILLSSVRKLQKVGIKIQRYFRNTTVQKLLPVPGQRANNSSKYPKHPYAHNGTPRTRLIH